MARFPFASCVPFSAAAARWRAARRERTGVLFRAAAHEAPPDDLLAEQVEALLGLGGADTLRYADARQGQRRAARLVRRRRSATPRLDGFLLGGDTRAEAWIKTAAAGPAAGPGLRPPAAAAGRHRTGGACRRAASSVCSCFGVTETAIRRAAAALHRHRHDERLAALQGALKCGTNCGSCLPELQAHGARHAAAAAAAEAAPS